jgi:bacterioferritin (cytochrome b1)
MELDSSSPDAVSRRGFLQAAGAAGAGGSAAFLAACGGGSGSKESKSAKQADIALLNSAIDLENTAIAAYTAGAPLLKGEALRLGREFLGHEKDHADTLSSAVSALGGRPPPPKASYRFPQVRNQREVLGLLDTIEHELVAAYLDALPKLNSPTLRAMVASILATEGEHISVVLGALGRPQVPTALVTGRG